MPEYKIRTVPLKKLEERVKPHRTKTQEKLYVWVVTVGFLLLVGVLDGCIGG